MRESKNSHVFAYVANLVARGLVRMGMVTFLRKSHSHSGMDQLWGVLARRIANTACLQDPESTMDVLRDELSSQGLRQWLANARVRVTKLNATMDWKTHFDPQGAKVQGGLLVDATSNHSFTFVLRKGRDWAAEEWQLNTRELGIRKYGHILSSLQISQIASASTTAPTGHKTGVTLFAS